MPMGAARVGPALLFGIEILCESVYCTAMHETDRGSPRFEGKKLIDKIRLTLTGGYER